MKHCMLDCEIVSLTFLYLDFLACFAALYAQLSVC